MSMDTHYGFATLFAAVAAGGAVVTVVFRAFDYVMMCIGRARLRVENARVFQKVP